MSIERRFATLHRKKKVHEFPVSSRDVTNQTPPGQEYISYGVIIPAQGEFDSDIPAGDGKLANLFFTVYAPAKSHKVLYHPYFLETQVIKSLGFPHGD
jgi:hypothetical protein